MVKVRFGTNHSDERYITKDTTLDNETWIDCDIFDPTNRLDPQIFVDTSKINLIDCNYMEIREFGRKYFITDIIGESGKIKTVFGHVDVLSTYDEAIRNCYCTATRSSSKYNFYLQDNSRIFNTYVRNQYKFIGDVGAPDSIILITV